MKKFVFAILIGMMSSFFASVKSFGQNGDIVTENSKPGTEAAEKDGDHSIHQSFSFTECGLDYIFAAQKVTDRISYPTGTGLPCGITIAGIPAGAVIVKSLLYWAITVDVTGSPNFSINGQSGVANLIGTGSPKCWYASTLYNDPSYVATNLVTQDYRADVTSMVTGNGTYAVNLTDWSRLIDGLGIIVVYKQPGTAWEGTLVINDGCRTVDQGNNANEFLPTVSPCVDACNVKTFSMVSDFATSSGDSHHYYTFNGGAQISKNDLFYEIDEFINPFPLPAGTQTIPYNIKSDSYFAATDCFDIIANGLYFRTYSCTACASNMQPNLTVNDANCGQCDGSATISPNGGSAPFSVQWNPGIATGTNLFTTSNLCAGDYSVTLHDNSGCITFVDSFTVAGTPAFQVDSVTYLPTPCSACNGSVDVFISNPVGNLTYNLALVGGATITQTNNGHFGSLCAGTYNLSVTDVNGCGHNEQITILQTSNVAIDSIQTVTDNGCVGHCNGTVSVFPNSGLNYSIDGGVTWQTTSVFTQVCNGNYTVIIKDSYGCTNTQSVSVNASPLQTSNGSDTTICQNGNAVLSVNASGGQTPYSYNWNPSGSTNSITVSPTSTQQYTVSITDALGCQSQTSTFNVTVLPPISIAGLQNLNYCQGVTTLVSASVTGGTGNYSYSWIDLGSQQILGTASSLNFTHSGSGTVLLIVHDDCTTLPDTVSFNYTEESQPALSLASSNTMGCPPFSTTLNLNNLPASASVDWNVGGQAFSTSGSNLDFSTSNIGCEDVLIAITTESGCHFNYEFDQVFCVAPLPTALFQYSPMDLTTMNSSFDLVNQSNPSYSSLWTISPNAMISDASAFNPSVTYAFDYADSIDVCLKVTDTLGCTATICSTIVIENEFLLYVPNCFTPDDDAFNQEFIPVTNVDPTETYEFMIFNRWGEQIFQTTDPKRGWNGTYKGQKAQDGTYIWKILMTKNSKTDGNQEFVGHINLLR